MSFRTRALVSIVTLSSLALFVACGGNSFNRGTPPPSGAFNNSNLNGTYVFSVTGSDATGFFQTIAGAFTANGSGVVTGGTIELNNAGTGFTPPLSITGGNYSVGADGRGGFLNGSGLNLNTSSGTLSFDFVLSSSSHGLITEFDGNGTGSGTLDLQSAVSQADINGKSYAFNLSGVYSVSSTTGVQTSFATVGSLTVDASGNITGFEDFNENGTSSVCGPVLTVCTITGGSISLATMPGTATILTNGNVTTLNFDVYPVDATHLKFIETDSLPFAAGDAFTQSSSIPAGNYVFTLAGFDSLAQGPFTSAGIITTDGNGNITNASIQDINDFGNVPNPVTFTGTYSAVSGGSSLLTLTGFVNGNNGAGCNPCQFAAYPSSGGLQLLEIDNGGSTAGVAYPQSATTLASGEGYGMNLTGFNFGSVNGAFEEDAIAEFVNTNGNFAGLIDFNDQGSVTPAQHFSSSYSADSTVPGRGVVTPGTNGFNLVSYVVDSSTAVFVEIDNNPVQVGIGSFAVQNASASSNAAAAHLKVLRLVRGAKSTAKRR